MGLETVEIFLELEEHFAVSIPDDVAAACITVGDTHREIAKLLAPGRNCGADALLPEVWDGVVLIVAMQMAMDPSDIKPDSRWAGDITRYG